MDATSKRTYNLPAGTILEVRSVAAKLHVSQDSVVARAVQEYARRQRDLADAAAWAASADDTAFQAEMAELASEFGTADRASWER